MPTWKSLDAFARELVGVEADLTGPEKARVTMAQAKAAQKIATQAASRDLGGDPKFSGWAPPLDTVTRSTRDNNALLIPTRRSAGPWTVAEYGRNKGNPSGFQGPGINIRTGLTARTKSGAVRKVRARRARRWNGYTAGKNTASDAKAEMDRALPKIADKAVRLALRKRFDVR